MDRDKPHTNRTSKYSPTVDDEIPGFPDDDTPQWCKLTNMPTMNKDSPFSTNAPKLFLPRVYLPNTTWKVELSDEKCIDKPPDLVSRPKKDDTSETRNKQILVILVVGLIAVSVAIPVTVLVVLQRVSKEAVITTGYVVMEMTLDEQFHENMTDRNSDLYLSTEKAICNQVDLAFTRDDSSLKDSYKLCTVADLRNGSIVVQIGILISGTFTVPAHSQFTTIITSTIGITGMFGQYRVKKKK